MDIARPDFALVRRGYEPAQVDKRLRELAEQNATREKQLVALNERLAKLESGENAQAGRAPAAPPTFADLGDRVGKILTLAEEEAADIRAAGKGEFETRLAEAEKVAAKLRRQADEYAEKRRADADGEAKGLVAAAHRKSDTLLEETQRDASARKAEADALFEAQRAKAAQAAADFETTLAERRDRMEQEFTAQSEASRAQMDDATARLEQTRNEAQKLRSDAEMNSRRLTQDAEQKAGEIVAQARQHADRIRAESDRELAAAGARRDAINAQLSNVRQMLSTLSNAGPISLMALGDEDAEAPEAEAPEAEAQKDA